MVNFLLFFFLFFFSNNVFSNDKLEVNADQFTYDKDNTRIFATGNVEVVDDEFKLYAEKVFLNNSSKVISAQENVRIFNSDGTILKAKKIVADQQLNNALIDENYLYIRADDYEYSKNFLKLAAKKVERRNKFWEKMDYGIFTACKICFDKKTGGNMEPLIQFKAKKIVHDRKNMAVKYYDAYIDIKGKSVFYMPYFSHASPLVKRKSGFLAPNFFQSHFFGFGADIPYYFSINEHHDFTLKPKFTTKKNPSLFLEHRKNFKNGEIRTEFSGTVENQEVNSIKENKKRGHIKTKGIFDINSSSYLSYKIHRTTDRNYLNTYKYGYTDILDSNFKLRSFRGNNYYSLESHLFQDLRQDVNQKEVPKVIPRVLVNLNSPKKFNKLNYETNIELTNISRTNGVEIKKLFFNQDINFPILFNDGSIFKLGGHISAGAYHIRKYQNPVKGTFENNQTRTNFFPQITAELSKPFYKKSKKSTSIFTPKILFVSGSKNAFFRQIPNQTNQNFDFDISDLFNRNRFSGNDRFDSNTRFDYGFSFLKNSNLNNKNTIIEIGQSYHLEKQRYINRNSGITEDFSDFVGRIYFNPNNFISLDSFFSFKKTNFSLKTANTKISMGNNDMNFTATNIYAPPVLNDDGENEIEKKNQFSLGLNKKIFEHWDFSSSTTFDKKSDIKIHNIGAKIKYEDECLGLSFSWHRHYTHNPEDPTSNSFMFLFSFKEIMENDL